ncbi:elicitor-responsive protein 3-like isoform X1 [Capsicum annuum]|uniref:elicitor-responsive protein 3-like isoform X1 n=1 Tax=Capsicum annuum TaxID=4072 RepID=UPI001FB096A6|nr:elicitor-responsive protein 3-like isoform X1 [Capsicum annuum]
MSSGTLEVFLENAKGLEEQNWLTSMNPYVVITCRTQEKESGVASGEGSAPEWNETFVFTISGDVEEITLKIMDKNTFSSDDFVGEATISLHEVLREGEVSARSYNVVKDEEYCGEIKLGLTFTSGVLIEEVVTKNMVDVENHVMTSEDLMKKTMVDVENHVMTLEDLKKKKNMADVENHAMTPEDLKKKNMVDVENHIITRADLMKTTNSRSFN